MKQLLLLLVILASSHFVCVAESPTATQPPPSPAAIRIQIEAEMHMTPIADDFMGLGYETSAVAREGFFSPKNTHMVQLYRTLSTGGLVRIGGIIGDHTRYEPDGQLAAQTTKGMTVINKAVIEDLGEFLRATGWKALWTLNLGTGSKDEAVQEALAVSAALGDRLQSFEIGNEVDQLKRFNSYEAYHAAYLDYKAAIRAVLPGAVFSGPDSTAAALTWTEKFAQAESQDMKLLLHHYYRGGQKSPEATLENLLAPHSEWEAKLRALHKICTSTHIAFRINEVNSFSGGGKKDVSDTFASALWCLDFMFRVASHGGAGVNMETDVNQLGFISHYSPIFRNEGGKLEARPEYYGMLAFALAGKGSLVNLTAGNTEINLTAYATKNPDGSIWVTFINKELVKATGVELAMPPGFKTAEAYRLTAPSAQSKGAVTLAGAQISDQGVWTPNAFEKIPIVSGTASFTVSASSAVLMRLH